MKGRIAFFSPRHFGQLGTPGTYRVIEEIAHYQEVRIFAQAPSDNSVYWRPEVPLIPLVGALSERAIIPILTALHTFEPDIIYIFNAPRWPEVIEILKKEFPSCKFVFDIKTPLLVDDEKQKTSIRCSGTNALECVDRVVTHAKASVDTWFSRCYLPPVLLPPGIDISNFPDPKLRFVSERKARREKLQWVYAASLHKMRQGSSLIQGFRIFLDHNPKAAVLHVYGDGADRAELERLVADSALTGSVVFHGLVPQRELFRAMATMDGAIGWVPRQLYDKSPSLKVLEYAAAGLPILATATTAHREMESDGFTLDFCDDTPESLAEGLSRWLAKGFAEERICQNRRSAEARDYSRLVRERLLPVLGELLDESEEAEVSQFESETKGSPCHEGKKEVATNPLRVLIIKGVNYPNDPELKQAFDLAGLMVSCGHRVYLAYQNRTMPKFELDERVVLFPYEEEGALETLVQGGRLDVMMAFSFDTQALLPVARVASRHSLPLIMHESPSGKCVYKEHPDASQKGKARLSWENEVVFSIMAERTNLMIDIASESGLEEWENLLRKTVINAESKCDFDSLKDKQVYKYERLMHLRRMRRIMLA